MAGEIRAGLAAPGREPFRQKTYAMGFRPEISDERALQLGGGLGRFRGVRVISPSPPDQQAPAATSRIDDGGAGRG